MMKGYGRKAKAILLAVAVALTCDLLNITHNIVPVKTAEEFVFKITQFCFHCRSHLSPGTIPRWDTHTLFYTSIFDGIKQYLLYSLYFTLECFSAIIHTCRQDHLPHMRS